MGSVSRSKSTLLRIRKPKLKGTISSFRIQTNLSSKRQIIKCAAPDNSQALQMFLIMNSKHRKKRRRVSKAKNGSKIVHQEAKNKA